MADPLAEWLCVGTVKHRVTNDEGSNPESARNFHRNLAEGSEHLWPGIRTSNIGSGAGYWGSVRRHA